MPTSKPYYVHDCAACTFLGRYDWGGQSYDLYTCKQGRDWPTVIARFSSDGPDYLSGLPVAKELESNPRNDNEYNHPLVEAMRRAKARGLLTREEAS
jgi:hypothetical protein